MPNSTLLRRSIYALALASFLAVPFTAQADVKLPSIISEHMVLQQDVAAPVWGTATPGEKISVKIGDQQAVATAGADGKWLTKIGPLKAGGPLEMTIAGNNSITFKDVLVGEVWVCSGQSNMGMRVSGVKDKDKEIAEADHPQIRMFTVANTAVDEPASDVAGSWAVCTPKNVPNFSATAYFFGRDLHDAIKRPVGLINSSWGGTAIQPWISGEAQLAEPLTKAPYEAYLKVPVISKQEVEAYQKDLNAYRAAATEAQKEGKKAPGVQPKHPAGKGPNEVGIARLYNGMIAPLIPYAIRGATWYQGEANGGQGLQYRTWMPQLITDWRKHWNQEGAAHDFPFLIVQLPNNGKMKTNTAEHTGWTLIREAEAKTAEKLPNVGTAVTIDTSSDGDLHPREKQPVGHRLALIAENKVYGMTNVVSSGPVLDSAKPDGDKLRITFKETHGGLEARGDKLAGFFVAGEDQKFFPADATMDGDAVVLHSADVAKPVAARYAWSQNPECNLFNKAGLPASPFRTDTWDAAPTAPVKHAAK